MDGWRPYWTFPPFRGNEREWIRAALIVFGLTLLVIIVAGSLDWLMPPNARFSR